MLRPEKHPTILVTGGAGFIGATLVPMLLERGYRVRVLDDLSAGSRAALAGLDVDFRIGDVRERATVAQAVAGLGSPVDGPVDGIVHLAAQTGVIDSVADPTMDFAINVGGTLNLLLECRDQQVGRFIFASSNAPIGENTPPIDEEKPARPLSPYGASKLAGEGYCSAFHGSYGLGTVTLRFANVYGPRSSHKGSVVARFLKDARQTGQLTIYGDGAQTRDMIYVDDLCRAIIAGLESDCGGETFQIATGVETSILDLAHMLQAEMVRAGLSEQPVAIVHESARAGEIVKNYSSIDKARRMLGWSPQISLPEGLRRTVAWFRAEVAQPTT